MPAAPLLRVQDLTITHAGASAPAVGPVSFAVSAGEVVLLLGPSGAGKSTLALALSGLIPHALNAQLTGSLTVCGLDAATTPVGRLSSRVSTVFQDPDAQIVTGSVLDETAFALENLCLPVPEILSRAETALRRMGLWERRSENPDLLSGGGRQRLAIAAALATGAPVLVLDEPTATLDPQGTTEVHAALADIAAEGDRAIVLVEHDLDGALEIATRTIVLDHDGRIAFDGPATSVLRDHADDLLALGVALPTAALVARELDERLAAHGRPPIRPLPLIAAELGRAVAEAAPGLDRGAATRAVDLTAEAPPPGAVGPADPIITARGLEVLRRGTPILHGVDLDIPAGSITAVIGPNGAGKSTLVQALAGVVPPPRGRVRIDGQDPGTTAPRVLATRIGFVFQNPEHQFIAHTVFDELAHVLRLRRTPAAEIDARVRAMLERFGLAHKADVHPFLLSGGEKRRLSVGTALITRPRVLVLDEPTFGQDRARTVELLALFHELREEGTTVVLVTHDHDLVVRHSTHTVLVEAGRISAAGPTAELVRKGLLPLPEAYRVLPPALRTLLTSEGGSPVLAETPAQVAPAPTSAPAPQAAPASPSGPVAARARIADPYAEGHVPPHAWLHRLNPLAKLAAVLPAMILLLFVRDLATPAAFLLLGYAIVLSGARLSARVWAVLLLAVPAGVLVLSAAMALWTDPAQVSQTPAVLTIGGWTLRAGAFEIGLATGLRLAAILALALVPGLTTTGPDLVRAGVQQLRVPYRIGYTALASYRFVPRFGDELRTIRAAHRVRGSHGGRGPFARIARGAGYVVPLLAGGIRHAERVALAMDSRAFGAHPSRTERHEVPFRARDLVFLVLMILLSAGLATTFFPWRL